MVRRTSELETNVVSIERAKEYSEIPSEVQLIDRHHYVNCGFHCLYVSSCRHLQLSKTAVLNLIGLREVT